MSWLRRLLGDRLPDGFTGALDDDEHVLAVADSVVATSRGLWLPSDDGHQRVGWHLISKATWGDGALSIVEAAETGRAGEAVLLADQPARRFPLAQPGKLPAVVRQRVDASIAARYRKDLPDGGGAWFVQRKTPDGDVLQVRADRGTDTELIADIAREAAAKLAGE